jgi:hypothetical protein
MAYPAGMTTGLVAAACMSMAFKLSTAQIWLYRNSARLAA